MSSIRYGTPGGGFDPVTGQGTDWAQPTMDWGSIASGAAHAASNAAANANVAGMTHDLTPAAPKVNALDNMMGTAKAPKRTAAQIRRWRRNRARKARATATTTKTTTKTTTAPAANTIGGGAAAAPDPLASSGGAYGLADAASVQPAVNAAIAGQVAPIQHAQHVANQTFQTSLGDSRQNTAAMQQRIAGLLGTARAGTGSLVELGAQRAAADMGQNTAVAAFLQRAYGAGDGSGFGGQLAQHTASQAAQQGTADRGSGLQAQIEGGLQQDFLNRESATAGLTQQSFEQGQREQLQKAIDNYQADIANRQGQAPLLQRQFMQQNDQSALQHLVADREYGLNTQKLALSKQQLADQEKQQALVFAEQKKRDSQAVQIAQIRARAAQAGHGITAPQQSAIQTILYGKPQTVSKVVKDAKGNPKTVSATVTVGQANDWGDAVRRLMVYTGGDVQQAQAYAQLAFPDGAAGTPNAVSTIAQNVWHALPGGG